MLQTKWVKHFNAVEVRVWFVITKRGRKWHDLCLLNSAQLWWCLSKTGTLDLASISSEEGTAREPTILSYWYCNDLSLWTYSCFHVILWRMVTSLEGQSVCLNHQRVQRGSTSPWRAPVQPPHQSSAKLMWKFLRMKKNFSTVERSLWTSKRGFAHRGLRHHFTPQNGVNPCVFTPLTTVICMGLVDVHSQGLMNYTVTYPDPWRIHSTEVIKQSVLTH